MRPVAPLVLLTAVVVGSASWTVVRPTEPAPVGTPIPVLDAASPPPPSSSAVVVSVTVAPTSAVEEVAEPWLEGAASPIGPFVVFGRAIDGEGLPIAGAEIELHASFYVDDEGRRLETEAALREALREDGVTYERATLTRTVTNPDGRFRLGPVERPATLAALSLSAFDPLGRSEGWASIDGEGFMDIGDVKVARLDHSVSVKSRVSVLVRCGGQPAPDARVDVCWYAFSSPHWECVITDAAGRASVVVDSVPVRLHARRGGFVARRDHVPVSSSDVEVALDLVPVRCVTGVVVDEGGLPVPGAWVEVVSLEGQDHKTDATTNGEGVFMLVDLGSGQVLLVAWDEAAPGAVRVSQPAVLGPECDRCVLVVERGATIVARRDSSGRPPRLETLFADRGWLPVQELRSRSDRWLPNGDRRWLAPGRFRVLSSADPSGVSMSSSISAGETVELPVPAETRDGRTVLGRVVRSDGSPIESASVQVLDGAWRITSSHTSKDGAFRTWIPLGTLTVLVDGGGPEPVRVVLPPGAEKLDLGEICVPGAP